MKRVITFTLAVILLLTMLPAAFAQGGERNDAYGSDSLEETVAEWENVAALYADYNELSAVTGDGRVLTTNDNFSGASKWTGIRSLCMCTAGNNHSENCNVLLGLKNDGTVLTISPKEYDSITDEIHSWRNVKELYCIDNTPTGTGEDFGAYALRKDGTIVYTKNLEEILKPFSGKKIKCLNMSMWSAVAVTVNGEVLTNEDTLRHDTDEWSKIQNAWIFSYTNGCFIIGRKTDGSTVLAVDEEYYSDEFKEDKERADTLKYNKAVFEKWKNVCAFSSEWENEFIVALTDKGSVESLIIDDLSWMKVSLPYSEDNYGYYQDCRNVKNAVSMTSLYYVNPEGSISVSDMPVSAYAFLRKNGEVADCVFGEHVIKFVPVEKNASIKALAYTTLQLYGLTSKGTVTRIRVVLEK